MKVNRWNWLNRQYEPSEVPEGWYIAVWRGSMHEHVNCAGCGKEDEYGNLYTSMEIHSPGGFGYMVCRECYEKEFERRIRYDR